MTLTSYRTLGRSGLAVSPLTLGTMTFGARRWGSGEAGSRAVFDAYVEAGGNVVDTADVYSGGESERMLGRFITESGLRDRLVLATKSGFSTQDGHPHAGGNGAKAIHTALEGSLRRLGTDHVDLFWIHVWDKVTPAAEVLDTLGRLVAAGKIRYFGLSNVPAFYLAEMATLARVHGVPGPIALQLEYSLAERGIEREHLPAARAFGLGTMPWSPLAGGFLTGKYDRAAERALSGPQLPAEAGSAAEAEPDASGRLAGANPFGSSKFTERNWTILETLRRVADEVGRSPAEVALAYLRARPGISSVVVGANSVAQMQGHIASLDIVLTAEQTQALDAVSEPEPAYPYPIFSKAVNRMVFGSDVAGWDEQA
ncbi:aldo/keto reductase [Aureimonas sp. AU12]|uniref:aldo/keto reductase n=1 Tax=Aureimonas sp. AU12 TaxID=1638161 RepID=UPI0007857732|nr:aldo/keto reductase [Aureimonas sp. AU12]